MKIAVVLVVALALAVVVDARTHANRKPNRHAKNAHRAELEEKVQKMSHIDIKGLEERVADADLNDDLQYEASQNIAQIKKNKKEMKVADGERAARLAQANELRLRALDLTLSAAKRDHEEDAEDSDEVPAHKVAAHKVAAHKKAEPVHKKTESHKVAKKAKKEKKQNLEEVADVLSADLDNLRKAVKAEKNFAKGDRKQALDNIMHMESDIEKYADTKEERFKKAFKLRSQVLRKLLTPTSSLEEAPEPKHQPKESAKKVHDIEHDVANLKKAVKSAHLDSATRKDAEENLASIHADAEQLLHTSSADARHKLHKAINLRVQALKKQLED